MAQRNAVIVDACRSAVARGGRSMLVHKRPDDLMAEIIKALLERNPSLDPYEIEDVRLGVCNQMTWFAGGGKFINHLAGLPPEVPGSATNRQCASSADTLHAIAAQIMVGAIDVGISAGVEKMGRGLMGKEEMQFRAPYQNPNMLQCTDQQKKMPPNHSDVFSVPVPDYILNGWPFAMMPQTAQNAAEMYGLTRQELDEYAYNSHIKAARAVEEGKFKDEIVPVEVEAPVFLEDKTLDLENKGDKVTFEEDECIRKNATLEKMASLPPLKMVQSWCPEPREVVITAGNSCPTNEGATAILLMSEDKAEQLGFTPLCRIKAFAMAGVRGSLMGLGPIPSSRKALKKAGLSIDDIGLIEINEAFAAMCVPFLRDLGPDPDVVNVNGGAIALGHALGNSGSRIITTLAHEMKRRPEVRCGLATMCVGDGQGAATVVERI
jgi:3-oxo-5,6-didehydrosuberyl-CoA/3-oxoadipyl-CoA thiolase